ncbi:MAG: hypothetical protein ACREKE_04535 [bacterium]
MQNRFTGAYLERAERLMGRYQEMLRVAVDAVEKEHSLVVRLEVMNTDLRAGLLELLNHEKKKTFNAR